MKRPWQSHKLTLPLYSPPLKGGEYPTVILNLFQNLVFERLEAKSVGGYAVIDEQSSRKDKLHSCSGTLPKRTYRPNVLTSYRLKQSKPHPTPLLEKERESNSLKRTYSTIDLLTYSLKKKLVAFTLAETLITLGIIGVVAAMTLPGLVADYQKKVLVNQFKKSYSNLSNALNLVQAEYGTVYDCYNTGFGGYHLNECKPFFDAYVKKLNIIKECSDWRNHCHSKYKTKAEVLAAGGEVNNNACTFDIDSFTTYYTLADGSLFALQNYGNPQHHQVFPVVDVNGMKGPNKWGYDLYMLTFHRKNDGQNVILSNSVCAMKEKGGMFLKEVVGE